MDLLPGRVCHKLQQRLGTTSKAARNTGRCAEMYSVCRYRLPPQVSTPTHQILLRQYRYGFPNINDSEHFSIHFVLPKNTLVMLIAYGGLT